MRIELVQDQGARKNAIRRYEGNREEMTIIVQARHIIDA